MDHVLYDKLEYKMCSCVNVSEVFSFGYMLVDDKNNNIC